MEKIKMGTRFYLGYEWGPRLLDKYFYEKRRKSWFLKKQRLNTFSLISKYANTTIVRQR